MTLSLPARTFDSGLSHFPRARAAQPGGARLAGIGIAVAAQLVLAAALVFGIATARAPAAQKPIFIELVKDKKQVKEKPAPLPKFVPPAEMTAPPPLIEIAAPPPVLVAARPKAVTMPPAPISAQAPQTQPAGGRAAYAASLLAYLERFKQYPAAARAAHIEGAVFVHFVMARDGTVRLTEISKSSGRLVLDREALAMIARAGRLPPMPADMKGETLDAVIGPIDFKLH